ncbi:MAG: hypothetical protein IPP35_11950 [Elusimicrobia bacterium]|nr:hypothetical protein [Elusimicrobiota bacterium]
MNPYESLMKIPPNNVADVLRRLTGLASGKPEEAPLLTLYLSNGASVAGVLLQFRKDHAQQFVVTVGHFKNTDGAAEALSFVPLSQISAVTIHHPLRLASVLTEPTAADTQEP